MAVLFMLSAATSVWAQTPVPDPDTLSNPVQQGDPAVRTLPPGLDYVEDKKRISAEEIPDPVRETLESTGRYSGWQKGVVFHDRNKDEYVVEFKEAGKTRSYRFNKDGKPVIEE